MKRIKVTAVKDGKPIGPTCGMCGASVASTRVVLCNQCAIRASQAGPFGNPTPPAETIQVAAEMVKTAKANVAKRVGIAAPDVDDKPDASLPALTRQQHTLTADPNPPMQGTKYRCSQCGRRYAARITRTSCQVAWMLHIDSMARAIRWDADNDNDIGPIDKALKKVYKWPAINRRVLIGEYRGWFAFKHEGRWDDHEPTTETAPASVSTQASSQIPVPAYEQEQPADEPITDVDEESEQAALSVPCLLPICTAPTGEPCRTGSGLARPAHAERIKSGKHVSQVLASAGQTALDNDAIRLFLERCTEYGTSAYQMQSDLHERFNVPTTEASKRVVIAKGEWRKRHPDKSMYSGNKQVPPDDFLRGGLQHADAAA